MRPRPCASTVRRSSGCAVSPTSVGSSRRPQLRRPDDARPDGTGTVIATRTGGRFGAPMTILAVAGLGIATYLLAARILGEPPACGPVKGCETVAASEYATLFGVPVALFGV